MARPFDAELYLRLAGERTIIDPAFASRSPWDSTLIEVGSSLAAIGALSAATVLDVVEDYQLALSLRGREGGGRPMLRRQRTGPTRPPPPLTPARVVACEHDVDQPWGRLHVHYVVFGQEATTLAVTAFEAPSTGGPGGMSLLHSPTFNQAPIADDQGNTEVADFNGGGSAGRWFGQLVTQQPLSRSTGWIEIAGSRVDLSNDQPARPPARVEPLAATDPAERHLRLRLATTSHGPMALTMDSIETSIETLIAAGALDGGAPIVAEALAVVDAFSGQGHAGFHPVGHGAASGPSGGALPPEWASLLARRGVGPGPVGSVPIGVVTPPVGEVTISFEGLVATEEGFQVNVATSPGISVGRHFWQQDLDSPRIAWWAEDNRGNFYLGGNGSWSGGPDGSQGTINYWPPIDARATELRLTPTGLAERAIVTLDHLPWAKRR